MAPRPLFSGTISFGLVSVPVRVFSAISEHKLQFHLMHEPDGGAIGYQKLCKLEEKPVPDDEVVKAFEVGKGDFVRMDDEDFELARTEASSRTIEITDFVPYADIDPLFFAKAYYVGAGDGGEHVYALLAQSMEDSGLAAIVT
ncbi:MAG TPA: Ku protein, partial [Gaiellaceae bacterium]